MVLRTGPYKPNGALLNTGYAHEACAKKREPAMATFGDIERKKKNYGQPLGFPELKSE